MQSKSADVKMRVNNIEKVVGTATYPEFDSVNEAVADQGEEKILEMVNAQIRTNEMNRVRGLARQGPSKKALEAKALAEITADEWQSIAGNPEAIRQLIDQKVEKLREAELAAVGATSTLDEQSS